MQNNNDHQPRLIAEPESEYTLIPEEQARKEEYRERLRQYLQDPEFRQIPGFPIGDDEAILELSDPPYYTACPNPFHPEIIEQWQKERTEIRKELGLPDDSDDSGNSYHREPFAADVSEGKNNPIYNAHSYHTKVPHKAIMHYLLHYTDPGDIVLDGFCGTGMTGVAANFCKNPKAIQELGYKVSDDSFVESGDNKIARVGSRKTILADLSPTATFIAFNLNFPIYISKFNSFAKGLLHDVEDDCDWMYITWHPHCDDPQKIKVKAKYIIWSDVYLCPNCNQSMTYWDVALDGNEGSVLDTWNCPNCDTLLAKTPPKSSSALKAARMFETVFDEGLNYTIKQAKQTPVLIIYKVGKHKYEKKPDHEDLELISKITASKIPYSYPNDLLPDGFNTRQPLESHGFSHVHHFYTKRNLWTLACVWEKIDMPRNGRMWISGAQRDFTKLVGVDIRKYFKGGGGPFSGGVKGTLYVPSVIVEKPITFTLKNRLRTLQSKLKGWVDTKTSIISTQDSSKFMLPDNSVDYIFTDPPFGGNLMYSELNFLWESWLKIYTNKKNEAIVNDVQKKSLSDYQRLMEKCFNEFYRLLKPGRWMTIEFHNSKNSVWNAIQEAILRAGFMIAGVRSLDKKQGSFKQMTSINAVKQDLIISAYKPLDKLVETFLSNPGSAEGVWNFIRHHLTQIPIIVKQKNVLEVIAEREAFLLFDRMVAFYVQRGINVVITASEFYAKLPQKFIERDGMFFLPDQAPIYDKAKLETERIAQLTLFVKDEKSTIQWLYQQLNPNTQGKSQTYPELQPKYYKQLQQARHEQLPELLEILEQNFLQDEQGRWYVPDPNKSSDLEKIRKKALLREFNQYLGDKKRLKQFRTEAVRAGFADAWQRKDFETIVKVAERLPETVLQEDPDLLMYYDNASLRVD